MKALAPLVTCIAISIITLGAAEGFYNPHKIYFHLEAQYEFKDAPVHRIAVFTTNDTDHNDFYLKSKSAFENGTSKDMILFFSDIDSATLLDTRIGWQNNLSLFLQHQPLAIWFGDSTLWMHPCTYKAPTQSMWSDTTTIYTPKQ